MKTGYAVAQAALDSRPAFATAAGWLARWTITILAIIGVLATVAAGRADSSDPHEAAAAAEQAQQQNGSNHGPMTDHCSSPADSNSTTSKVTVVFPPDKAVLLHNRFHLICKGDAGQLLLDGRPPKWEPTGSDVHVATVRLSPGMHTITAGEHSRRFVVALNEIEHDGPADWPIWHYHPIEPDTNCGVCHLGYSPQAATFPEPSVPDACLECHDVVQFEAIHQHPLDPIDRCSECHAPHGSSHQRLLTQPKEELCAKCHES